MLTRSLTTDLEEKELLTYSEERFRTLVDNIPGAVYRCANERQVQGLSLRTMVFFSEAIQDISGYPSSDFINNRVRSFTSIIHPQDRVKVEQAVWESTIARQPYVIEYRIIRADGRIAWVYDKGQGVFDENEAGQPQGLPLQFDGVILDITDRKQTQAELRCTQALLDSVLRESEAHYRRILETASEGIWMFDSDSKTTFANDRIAEMLGYTVEEMLGRSLFDFIDEESRMIAATYVERRRQGIPERHDFKFRRKDGSNLWAIVSARPILDAAGQFVGVLRMITDISDRKRAEEVLQEREQFLRSIYEGVENSIFVVDVLASENSAVTIEESEATQEQILTPAYEFRYRGLNLAHERLTGIRSEQWRGRTPQDILPPPVAAAVSERYAACIRAGTTISYEECLPFQGKDTWWITTLTPLRDGQGRIYRLIGTSININDRKQAEEALRESERRFRAIFDSMFQFIGLLKPDGTLLEANQTALEFAGLQLADVTGRPFWEIRWWSLSLQTQERLKAAIALAAAGEFVRYEVDVLGAGDRVVTIDFSIKPFKDESGQVVLLIPEGRDISDKKQAEKALRESEQRFRATFAQAAVGIAHVNLEGQFLRINQKFCSLVGYTHDEMLVRTLQDITHPDDLDADLDFVRQMLSGQIQMYSLEKRYITRRGEIVWVNLTVSLRRRSSGEPKYFILVVQDISDKKHAEEALRHSESELRAKNQELQQTLRQLQQTQAQLIQNEKMASLGQMVAGIAHEINNPISFIYGNVSYAQQYAYDLLNLVQLYGKHYSDPVPEIQNELSALDLNFLEQDFPKLLHSMQEGANRIREIVLSLRNFSRLDEADLKKVNIHEGIDNTLLILQHRLKEHSYHREIQVRKEYGLLPLVECYAGPLNQVFMNLFSNAIDALEHQPAPRVITISTSVGMREKGNQEAAEQHRELHSITPKPSCSPQYIVIRIADNGPGIPEEVKKHIFDPFFTTKPVGVGTGLGLSISHSIVVEKHSGQLACISTPGQGTEFIIELPVQQTQQCSISSSIRRNSH
jgi:two-component system, NtrC family, sensor kinase